MRVTINENETEAVVEFSYDDLRNNPTHRIASWLVPQLSRLLKYGAIAPDKQGDHEPGKSKVILQLSTRVE